MGSNKPCWPALSREEVIKAVERRGPSRIPLVRAKWWGEGLADQYGDRLSQFDRFPEDVFQAWLPNPIDPARMGLSWEWAAASAHDSQVVIDDWAKLDEFIEKRLDPAADEKLAKALEQAKAAHAEGRYVLLSWWNLFFERPWKLRGMENLLCDYHTDPQQIARLHDAMCDTYCRYIDYAMSVARCDGFFSSDDLGHQTQSMMSPQIFHELHYPYYRRVGQTLRKHNLHFWLHSCGNNTPLLDDLIDAGVDMFHPVQKHTMDERDVAQRFGDRLGFFAGIDVQHTLREKDPAGVRAEVRFLIDTFDRPEGGMCIAAGNGIVGGTPIENIEAFLDEAVTYGSAHRRAFASVTA